MNCVDSFNVNRNNQKMCIFCNEIVKTGLQNKMKDGFVRYYPIEDGITEKFTSDMKIDDINSMKQRRKQLH